MRENVIYGENVTYDESVNRRQLAWHTATQARPDLHPGRAVQVDVIYARLCGASSLAAGQIRTGRRDCGSISISYLYAS